MEFWKPLAGLALFLLAMSLIEESVRSLAGDRVRRFIEQNTQSRLRGLVSGTVATALLQSSSLVGLLVLALVGAGIMQLPNALLIIFGANLGTTFTGWLVTVLGFKLELDALSFPLIASGGLLWALSGTHKLAALGRFGLALGLLLMALEFMKSAMGGYAQALDPSFLASLSAWQFLLFGIGFSALVQSSSATMVVTLSALHIGVIDLYAAAAIAVGADLGTTSTVVLGALKGSANKKRVALGHVLFNVATDSLAFVLLIPLVDLVANIGDPLLALVAFHSVFNLLGVCLFTPFVPHLARFLAKRFVQEEAGAAVFLDPSVSAVPEVAVGAVGNELKRLSQQVVALNAALFRTGRLSSGSEFRRLYRLSKRLEAEMLAFSLNVDLSSASGNAALQVEQMLDAARNLMLSAKLIKDNLTDLDELADYAPALHEETMHQQRQFYDEVEQLDEGADLTSGFDAELRMLNQRGHEALHDRIYELIRGGLIPLEKVSSLLNVNRALFNSNAALIDGLAVNAAIVDHLPHMQPKARVA